MIYCRNCGIRGRELEKKKVVIRYLDFRIGGVLVIVKNIYYFLWKRKNDLKGGIKRLDGKIKSLDGRSKNLGFVI